MIRRVPIRHMVAAALISPFLSLVITVGQAQAVPFVSPVTTTVFDESGAVIPNCEVAFRSDSRRIASRTGPDGSATVVLQNGIYSVTATRAGFVRTLIRDVQVPMSEPLRFVMKVDHTPIVDGPILPVGPTSSAYDLPDFIAPEPSRVPTPGPASKNRSWRCLYLWKCSTS